jgi:hypothetical protein
LLATEPLVAALPLVWEPEFPQAGVETATSPHSATQTRNFTAAGPLLSFMNESR